MPAANLCFEHSVGVYLGTVTSAKVTKFILFLFLLLLYGLHHTLKIS